MPKKSFQKTPKEDKVLFTYLTILLHYWIVEKYNLERVKNSSALNKLFPHPSICLLRGLSVWKCLKKTIESMEMKLLDYERQGKGMSSQGRRIPQRFTVLPIMLGIHQIPSRRLYVGWAVEVDNHPTIPRRQHQKRKWELRNNQSLRIAPIVKRHPPLRSM